MTKKEFYLSIAGKGDFFAPMKQPVKSDILYRYMLSIEGVKPLVMRDGKYYVSSSKELEEVVIETRRYVATLTFVQEGKLKKEVIFKELVKKEN